MYDAEKEKQNVLGMLREASQEEIKYTKDENFKRAVSFATDEVLEFEQLFNKFISDVSHLEVFQDSIKEPLTKDMGKMIHNLKYLIEKNYTAEDKEKMPAEVLQQVRASQEKRINLLKKVARRYLSPPKQD